MKWRRWFDAFVMLFYPKVCLVCAMPLRASEECLCVKCQIEMPRTNLHLKKDNEAEQLFWGKLEIERVSAYFYYRRGSDYREIIHQLKYKGRQEVGRMMGRCMAAELSDVGFFSEIDLIIPIPLHAKKKSSRGYNQSECIAEGISAFTGICVDATSVSRQKYTATQTRKSVYERWANVDGIFELSNSEKFVGKHILLVDDVLTTGATCAACAAVFANTPDIKLSVLTLAMAK